MDPEYLPAYSSLAALYINANQPERAIEVYRKLLERKPSANTYTLIGMAEMSRKNYGEAVESYRKALELNPDSEIAENNLAWLYSEAEWQGLDLDEAVRLARAVVGRKPEVPGFADTLGWAYYKKGMYAEAKAQLAKAVSLSEKTGVDVEIAFYRFRLGVILAASGDKAGARLELLKALELGGADFKQADQARKALASL